nr:hypothetical protein BaRGS_007634 [Batillaria attramentaria]
MGGAVHRTRRFLRGYDEIADDSSDVKQLVGDFLGVDHAPARTSRSKATLGADELKYLKMDLNRIAEEGSKARERGNQSSDAKTAGSSHNATTSTKDKDGDGERGHNRRSATAHVKKRDFKSLAKGPSAPNDRYGKVIKSEGGDEAPADTSDDLAMDFSFHTQGDEGLINSIIENNRIHTDELFMDSKVPKDFRYRRSSDDDDADKSELILNMDSLLDGTHAKNLDNEDILQHLLGKTTKERDSGKVNKDGSNMDYNDDLFKDGLDDEFKSKAKSVLEDPDKVVSKDGDEEEEDDDDDDDYEEEEDDDELPLDPNGGKPPKDSNPNNPYPKIIGFRGDGTNRLSLGLGGVKLPITHHAEDFMSKKFDNTIASVDEPQ